MKTKDETVIVLEKVDGGLFLAYNIVWIPA